MWLQEYDKTDSGENQVATGNNSEVNPEKKSYFKTKIALATIVVLVIVTFGYLFYRHTEKAGVEEKTQAHEEHKTKIIYYDMSPIVVNLDTNTEESKFLKISISLVLKDNQGLEVVKELEPSIRDTYFVYLRQLRPSDVRGPIAIYRG